jgi:hypothetical protein
VSPDAALCLIEASFECGDPQFVVFSSRHDPSQWIIDKPEKDS